MSGTILLLAGAVCFAAAYLLYGRYLTRLFGVDDARETPATTARDGIDYVPTRGGVLFGHHFASIAGAGPIVGPIAAAYFGWAPVVLWIVIGCILVGAMHDFAALFLSVRHGGRSIGYLVETYIGFAGRQIFLLFAWAALVLVVAVFAFLVAKTFVAAPAVATSSLLFIAMAPLFGYLVYRKGIPVSVCSLLFVPLLFAFVWVGGKLPCDLVSLLGLGGEQAAAQARNLWLGLLFVYAFVASVIPVWLLLQPRDYLNSYLLYVMIGLGFAGVIMASPAIEAPAFTGWVVPRGEARAWLFPLLFVTVACGACSGFHSLVSSGTTAKQVAREKHILPIAYGGMLVEGLLAIMALISVAYLGRTEQAALIAEKGPVAAFASGLAHFCETLRLDPRLTGTFFTLAISAFLLTTLDTATRLTRFTWQELFLPGGQAETRRGALARAASNRFAATGVVVAAAGYLAFSGGWQTIWPVFGASNQLLAALTLLVVTLVLVRRRANFWIALVPMAFMAVICVWALVRLFQANLGQSMALVVATAFLLLMALVLVGLAVASLRGAGRAEPIRGTGR